MTFSPPSLLDLPTELKSLILGELDVKSLVNMSMTCKSINGIIYATNEFNLEIEMAKSELVPAAHIRPSSALARRRSLQEHRTSRLTLPLETRRCDLIIAPNAGIVIQRLFKGLLACVTDDSTLHVWDIRHRPDGAPPRKVLMISEPGTCFMDVLIEPQSNLLVLLCYDFGNDVTTIKLLDLSSNGTRPHPWAMPHPITVPEEPWVRQGRQLLTLHGPLLAFVYCRIPPDSPSRRGIILDWRTGNRFYDSTDFDSNFHDLLLLTPSSFLVTASTPPDGPPTEFGGWIELRICESPASSRLVSVFHLPEFDEPAKYDLEIFQFYVSEPPSFSDDNEDNIVFPFVSDPSTSIQVLHIWYTPRLDNARRGGSLVYLVISNRVFADVLKKVALRDVADNHSSIPLRFEWDDWGPPWTSIWGCNELELLSDISSICGSRICSGWNPTDGCMELLVVDFNMNFPCTQRDCTNPSGHFSPKSFRSSEVAPLWTHVVHTWLPFHTQRKWITVPRIDDDLVMMCTTLLMDEERIVISICATVSPTFDPTSWRIIHMLCDRQNASIGDDPLLPWPEDIHSTHKKQPIRHDRICRLCKEKPHTDPHILLECTAHPEVVRLRQNLIEYLRHRYPALYHTWSRRSFDELLNDIKGHRGARIRVLISSLVTRINKIYGQLQPCSESVLVDQDKDKPASIFFVTLPKFVPSLVD